MKRIFYLLTVVLTLALCSCNTQQRAINQMRDLTYDIETNGEHYDSQDWQNAYQDYQRINDRLDNRKLTSEQRAEVGELKGRCVSKFAKCAVKSVVNSVTGIISEGAGIIKGIIDGITN